MRGKVGGLDVFDHPETWAREMGGLVRSYGLDSLDPDLPSTRKVVTAAAFLEDIGRSVIEQFPALGLGADLRLHGTGVVGGALVVDDAVVHLVAFPAEAEALFAP